MPRFSHSEGLDPGTWTNTRAGYIDGLANWKGVTSSVLKCYPSGQAGPQASSSGSTAWVFGNYVEVVPASTITNDFIITGIMAKVEQDGLDCEIVIGTGSGGSETEIIRLPFVPANTTANENGLIFSLPIPVKVSANSRVAFKFTDDTSTSYNCRLKIIYFELPLT